MSGPKVVYEGSLAGLSEAKRAGGDTGSPFDYVLYCSCQSQGKPTCLGPLGRFRLNEGRRSAYCPACKSVTVMDQGAQILHHGPFRILQNKV
jgi:hypothetical protein